MGQLQIRICKILAILAITAAVFYPLQDADFIWDDHDHFVSDVLQTEPDALQRIWFSPNKTVWNYWPVSRSSFWLERQLWGVNAAYSHYLNIVLHTLSAVLLFCILTYIRMPGAWLAALIFAIHPLTVESVSWIAERKNVLSMFFFMLSIGCYFIFDDRRRSPFLFYGLSILFYILALLSKSSVIVLPLVIAAIQFVRGRPWNREFILSLLAFIFLSCLSALVSIYFEEHYIGTHPHYFDRTFLDKVLVASTIPFFYLKQFIFPSELMFIYPRWQLDPAKIYSYLPLISLLLSAVIMVIYRKKPWCKVLIATTLVYLACLFPVMSFFKVYGMRFSYVADHWAYVSLLPLCTITALGMHKLLSGNRKIYVVVSCSMIALLSFVSWNHTKVYLDPFSLWQDTVSKNPSAAIAHNHLASMYAKSGDIQKAGYHLSMAIQYDPYNNNLYRNRAILRKHMGDLEGAIQDLRTSVSLLEDSYGVLYPVIAEWLILQGNEQEAIEEYDRAIAKFPDDPVPRDLKQKLLEKMKDHEPH